VTAEDCRDGNTCTADACTTEGVCAHPPVAGCTPCEGVADCDDQDPCTVERCGSSGSCEITALPGCVRCGAPEECDDGDPCTADVCGGGVCQHTDIDECPACEPIAETCNDGVDNDCDDLTDCDDPDCGTTPACTPASEQCGDCRDNDGDGLVDYDDPDCCDSSSALGLANLKLRTQVASLRQDRLHLKSVSVMAPDSFDPLTQDTSLQITDEHGNIFCTTVGADHWMRLGRRSVTFWDKEGLFAGGLADGRFTLKRDGRVIFRTHGPAQQMRAMTGTRIRVTVRVGTQCTSTKAAVRTKRFGLVYP
jgi:hypothetical protein